MIRITLSLFLLIALSAFLYAEDLAWQGFEQSPDDTWVYSANNIGSGYWGIMDDEFGGAAPQSGSQYWASWNMGSSEGIITHANQNLPLGYLYSLSFYYYTRLLSSPTEYSRYCLSYDNGLTWTEWTTLLPNTQAWTQVSIEIPVQHRQLMLKVAAKHGGTGKYAHWDSFLLSRTPAPPQAPVIYNLQIAQRTDGSGLVDINYDLFDANNDPCTVALLLSDDEGATYTIIPNPANLSGDIGTIIDSGLGKHIIWYAKSENYSLEGFHYRFRLGAEDNSNPGTVATPVFSPEAGTYFTGQNVNISCGTVGASIYYTIEGSNPSPVANLYTSPINIPANSSIILRAYATLAGWIDSDFTEGAYTISEQVENPFIHPTSGVYTSPINVSMSVSIPGSVIRYTIDGSDPTVEAGILYNGSFLLDHNSTVKAKAYLDGLAPSNTVTENYFFIVTTPMFYPPGGIYSTSQNVIISCISPGATIRYTVDGNEPTESSTIYEYPVSVTVDTTIKAKAFKAGWTESQPGAASYSIIHPNFILVSSGNFDNGTSNVSLSSFFIDKYELTQARYQAVMGTNPSYYAGNPNRPVEQVSWYNAIEYCNRRSMQEGLTLCYSYGTYGTNPDNWPVGWNTDSINHINISCNWTANGYRLPTEMEWMFAAKGGEQSQDYTYSGSNTIGTVAWYSSNSSYMTWDVGLKVANEIGTIDMSGNAAEWCWDILGSYPSGMQTNPTGASNGSQRVFRGGSWSYGADYCTVSSRSYNVATYCDRRVGFRCVRRAP